MVTTPTSGPQIQDFKVRNAIDQITTGLNAIETRELVSISATAASNVLLGAMYSSAATAVSLAASPYSLAAVADGLFQVITALRTAKLMR